MNAFHKHIDWQRPWLAPLQPLAAIILQEPDWRYALNAVATHLSLHNHRGMPIRFVEQTDLPAGIAYEAFISATGSIPTRDNLHDFFNALVWLTWPCVKRQLNALQAKEIAQSADIATRGKLRDAATIFDENAALLVTRDLKLIKALQAHEWHDVFWVRRAAFARDCELYLFGHALMEKLVTPYKAITAHTCIVTVGDQFFAMPAADRHAFIESAISARLEQGLTTSDFTPLPVLGVPEWWDVQDEGFYNDAHVFRPKRKAKQALPFGVADEPKRG
jgi:hypothetical protein